ncbi:tetraacyldisaccharide 4'-kinase [Neisseria sp.]|uniref:tetraacyldisaccharide 4'-kinase n=1 Tax=Neisseria sp. TaxID=192066 RepID=UPI0035A0BA30
MPKLHQIIERHWQHPNPLLAVLLWPLSRLFQTAYLLRRRLYRTGRLNSEKLPVPVVVVGNIHAGGVGKTPVVAALVSCLQRRGLNVGIISRGYGRETSAVYVLDSRSTAEQAGDEPLLLHRQTAAPVAVGSRRAEAGRALLAAYPNLDVIVADDGLQHYALQRDVEIAVFPFADCARRNLDLLPNGGLREPLARLDSVDAVVVSGFPARPSENGSEREENPFSGKSANGNPPPLFRSRIETAPIYRFNNPQEIWDAGRLKTGKTAAVAGIAKPERFFDTLRGMGIRVDATVSLPDHAAVSAADFPAADAVFITEKDAVKLKPSAATGNVWVLPVCAIIEPDLAGFVAGRLKMDNPTRIGGTV